MFNMLVQDFWNWEWLVWNEKQKKSNDLAEEVTKQNNIAFTEVSCTTSVVVISCAKYQ